MPQHQEVLGDGRSTDFTVRHGLSSSTVDVVVTQSVEPFDDMGCHIDIIDDDTVQLRFAAPPDADAIRVTVTTARAAAPPPPPPAAATAPPPPPPPPSPPPTASARPRGGRKAPKG